MIATIKVGFIAALFLNFSLSLFAKGPRDFYQIKIYHCKNDTQLKQVNDYLENDYLPALHRFNVKNIGVFTPISNDTASVKLVYVLIPFKSEEEWLKIDQNLLKDVTFATAAKDFLAASADEAPYERMESILLEAFEAQQKLLLPTTKNADRVFELRSYESPTEVLFEKKVAMFNTGGEIPIFNRLGFNPVFYGKVISGSRMPNLMYMPVFDNEQKKNEGWKRFGSDSTWKRISTDPANQNDVNVNHIDSIMMHSTDYSDY